MESRLHQNKQIQFTHHNDWNVVFQLTPTKVDFAVKTRPCLISEARNFLKPSSSSTAVNPNGSKNPSGSLAPICWEGWNALLVTETWRREDVFPVKLLRDKATWRLPSAWRPNCWMASCPLAISAAKIPRTEIIAMRPLFNSLVLISSLYIWRPNGSPKLPGSFVPLGSSLHTFSKQPDTRKRAKRPITPSSLPRMEKPEGKFSKPGNFQ